MTPEQFSHISNELRALRDELHSVKRFVDGGSEPENGLNTRVSFLERDSARAGETARNAKNVAWSAAATAVGAIVLWIGSKLMKGPLE